MVWNRVKSFFRLGESEEEYLEEVPEERFTPRRKRSFLGLPRRGGEEIFVRFPKSFEEAKDVADCLKDRHVVILNLQDAPEEDSRRVVDFLSGVTYALDGNSEKIHDLIFLFAPSHFFVSKQ